ncbi:MAG: hypothetical protein E6J90_41600 [Deltaproteobacteria bacterium]|nr:MAG: hypothetical protein E6J90_41600 [Deltaproteobacteria bacterium]
MVGSAPGIACLEVAAGLAVLLRDVLAVELDLGLLPGDLALVCRDALLVGRDGLAILGHVPAVAVDVGAGGHDRLLVPDDVGALVRQVVLVVRDRLLVLCQIFLVARDVAIGARRLAIGLERGAVGVRGLVVERDQLLVALDIVGRGERGAAEQAGSKYEMHQVLHGAPHLMSLPTAVVMPHEYSDKQS